MYSKDELIERHYKIVEPEGPVCFTYTYTYILIYILTLIGTTPETKFPYIRPIDVVYRTYCYNTRVPVNV